MRQRADIVSSRLYRSGIMAKSKQLNPPAAILEELLDKVSNAREELIAIERTFERLRADVTRLHKDENEAQGIA